MVTLGVGTGFLFADQWAVGLPHKALLPLHPKFLHPLRA